MRAVVPALLLASLVLTVAAPCEAAKVRSPVPASATDGLRGPEAAQAKPKPVPLTPSAPRLAAAAPSSLAATPADAGSCRLTCARKYYFCLAGDGAEQCPGPWIQCRTACGALGQGGGLQP